MGLADTPFVLNVSAFKIVTLIQRLALKPQAPELNRYTPKIK